MSVQKKNKQRLTPRQHAQRADRFKFHRVIKLLREIEEKESNLTTLLNEDEQIEKEQISFPELMTKNKELSFAIAILVGIICFLLEKFILTEKSPEL